MEHSPDTCQYTDYTRSWWFAVRIPPGAWDSSFLQIVQTGSEANPASWSVGKRVLSRRQNDRGVKLIIQHLAPNLRISGATHLPSLNAINASTGTTTLLLWIWIMAPYLWRGKTEGEVSEHAVLARRNITGMHCWWIA